MYGTGVISAVSSWLVNTDGIAELANGAALGLIITGMCTHLFSKDDGDVCSQYMNICIAEYNYTPWFTAITLWFVVPVYLLGCFCLIVCCRCSYSNWLQLSRWLSILKTTFRASTSNIIRPHNPNTHAPQILKTHMSAMHLTSALCAQPNVHRSTY